MRNLTTTLAAAANSRKRFPLIQATVRDMRLRFSPFTQADNPWGLLDADLQDTRPYVYGDACVLEDGTIIRAWADGTGDMLLQTIPDPTIAAHWWHSSNPWASLGFQPNLGGAALENPGLVANGNDARLFYDTGTADTGGAWTTSGIASVVPHSGRLTVNKSGAASAYLPSIATTDTDTTVTVTSDKVGTGGGTYLAVLGRRISSGNDYQGRIRLTSTNSVAIRLVSEVAGAATALTGETRLAVTYTPGMLFDVRLQVTATNPTTLRLKVWQTGATEPSAWQLTATDSTPRLQANGSVGFWTYLSGSATNAPTTMKVSNFTAGRPPTGDPVLGAAGDIACAAADTVTATTCQQAATAALLAGNDVTVVQTLGDNQYNSGTSTEFNGGYDLSWGRLSTRPPRLPAITTT